MKPRRGRPKDKNPFSQKRQALKFHRSKGKRKPDRPNKNPGLENKTVEAVILIGLFILLMILIFIIF